MIPVLMEYDPMDHSPHAPLSMGLFRQEYWSGLPFPPPGDLPNPEIISLALAGQFFTTSTIWEVPGMTYLSLFPLE